MENFGLFRCDSLPTLRVEVRSSDEGLSDASRLDTFSQHLGRQITAREQERGMTVVLGSSTMLRDPGGRGFLILSVAGRRTIATFNVVRSTGPPPSIRQISLA
jgi:hypothetical protein